MSAHRDAGQGDRCPYPRPFRWDFADCPAFMPRLYLPTDTRGRELKAQWTCAHLAGRRADSGAFYPGCILGDSEERRRWAATIKEDQLAAIRSARVSLSQFIRPRLEGVRSALGESRDPLDSRRRAETNAAWTSLLVAFRRFVEGEPRLFQDAGIDPAELVHCFEEAMAEFSKRPGARQWQMADSVVGRYSWPIVAFFRPDLARDALAAEGARAEPNV